MEFTDPWLFGGVGVTGKGWVVPVMGYVGVVPSVV